jgi:uncharacterized protein involved in exopolysaccharide biosynthesis
VSFSSSAPARQPAPELPKEDIHSPSTSQSIPESGENAVVYLRLLWENRRLLFHVAVCALLSSALIACLIPTRYESTARLMPPDNQSGSSLLMGAAAMSGGAGGLGGIAGDLLGVKGTSDVFVGILSSRTVQDKLIQQFDLKRLYKDRRMDDARTGLAARTNVSLDRKSQIIAITVADNSPQRAAAMSQAYVEELDHLVAGLSTSSARRERIFLEGRLEAVNHDLEVAEKNFSQFASKNTAIDINEQGRAMVQAVAALQGQLIATESEYEGLRQIYTNNNVRVRSVRARMDELKHQLEKLGGNNESVTAVPEQPNDFVYPSIRKLPLLGVTFADLYRRTKIQETVLETLTREYELAKVQEAKEIPRVKVLDVANIPDRKSFPPRLLIIFLGSVLVMAVAVGWVFASTLWRETDASDPRKMLAQEVFSSVSARLPMFSRIGSSQHSTSGRVWSRSRLQRNDSEKLD